MRYFLALCTVSLLLAAGSLSGRRAPGFSLMDTTGQQHDLYDLRGKLVLIDMMQTTCPHCRTFSKILDRVKAKYGERVAVLAVVNPPETPATVSRFMQDMRPSYSILFDSGQMAISYFKATPQNPSVDLPHLFFVDASGWIISDFEYSTETKPIFEGEAIFPEIDKLLAKRK